MRAPDARWGSVALTGSLSCPSDARSLLVVLHGLGGNTESVYMRRCRAAALERGLGVLLLNGRGADGSGEDVYHAGLVQDLEHVLSAPSLARFDSVYVLGYSLGGHVALRAATLGLPARVKAVAAVAAPLQLEQSVDAFDRPERWLYRRHVLAGLKQHYAAVAQRRELPTPVEQVQAARTIREWDALVVCPRFGYPNPATYYAENSAGPRLAAARAPLLYVGSRFDPMVPFATVGPSLERAPAVEVRWTGIGGHVGYPAACDLGMGCKTGLEHQVIGWLSRHG